MLAGRRMAYIANSIEHSAGSAFNGVAGAFYIAKHNWGSGFRHTKNAVGGGGDHALDHVDIVVAVRIVAVPAEFDPFPGAVNH
jgi:hypothetical protein